MSGDACKSIGLLLGAHLDGQLDPVKTLEVEEHIEACEVCRERLALDRALRGSLKKAVKTTAPSDVRARMLAAMAGENARQSRNDDARDDVNEADLALDAPLLCNQSRRRISTRRVQHAWAGWQRVAALDRSYPFHSLRHTAVTNVYRASRDLFLAQRFARHVSPLTTTVYTHPGDDEMAARVRGLSC